MHHWCRSARSACGPLRLRRARSARKTRWAHGKRALQQSACRPARARPSLFLSCHALEIAPLRPSEGCQEALKAFELALQRRRRLAPALRPLWASAERRAGCLSCGGFVAHAPDRPRLRPARCRFPVRVALRQLGQTSVRHSAAAQETAVERLRQCVRYAG
jgi:hypothetical protein